MPIHAAVRILAVGTSLVATGCVYLPRTTTMPDAECLGWQRQMVLEEHQIAFIQGCSNQGCLALLAGAGIVTAASVVVSGSIAVVGNVVYWLERRANCAAMPSS